MKLSLMTLGDMVQDPITGHLMSATERFRGLIAQSIAADRGGLYGINLGEHHGLPYCLSAPPVVLAAIAERTSRLRLGTAVALAANLDPLRMAEDYATLDVLSGGRVDLVTGRGNFFESTYALFGHDVDQSPARFREAMELTCALWPGKPLTWTGQFRAPINGETLQPAPIQSDALPIWVGGGSSAATAELAGELGLKLMLPSAFGPPHKFVEIAELYRAAYVAAGHPGEPTVGACWHGWLAPTTQAAEERFAPRYRAYHAWMQKILVRVNRSTPEYLMRPFDFEFLRTRGPAIVGSPQQFTERLVELATLVGADVNLIYTDMGGAPTDEQLAVIELLAAEVIPVIAAR